MIDFFNGKAGLAKTYWLGVFGVGLITQGIMRVINRAYIRAVDDAAFGKVEFWHNIFLGVLCVYMVLMLRALIKAGFDDRRPGFWGWTGIGLTALGAIYALFITVTVWFPSVATPRLMIEIELSSINRQLPQQVEPGMTLDRAMLNGDDLIYVYTINGPTDSAGKLAVQAALRDYDDPSIAALCADVEGYFRGGIERLIYEYHYTNDKVQAVMQDSECLAHLE